MSKPITCEDLADALGCFWNAALGARQAGADVTVCAVEGIQAVADRLKEIDTANISPVAPAGDREAVGCTNCGWTGSALKDGKPREHCAECGMPAWSAFRSGDQSPALSAEERAVALKVAVADAFVAREGAAYCSPDWLKADIALSGAKAALFRAHTGAEG